MVFFRKDEFCGSIEECLKVLQEKFESFLTHVFIKRQQSAYFEKMKSSLTDESICVQVDFSQNFRIDIQDAIQSSYDSNNSVSLFTCYVWCSNGGHSFVYASNDLSHDKYCISTVSGSSLGHIEKPISTFETSSCLF